MKIGRLLLRLAWIVPLVAVLVVGGVGTMRTGRSGSPPAALGPPAGGGGGGRPAAGPGVPPARAGRPHPGPGGTARPADRPKLLGVLVRAVQGRSPAAGARLEA